MEPEQIHARHREMERQVENAERPEQPRDSPGRDLDLRLSEDVQRALERSDRASVPFRSRRVARGEATARLVEAVENDDGGQLDSERVTLGEPPSY